ncbi:hypothetical protein [Paenibacillus ferrarius]|uniref:hypothetical protein n=1 Tax=Paenibacillus ferrarius TaxID=1469647 RepID=UPI003D27DF46
MELQWGISDRSARQRGTLSQASLATANLANLANPANLANLVSSNPTHAPLNQAIPTAPDQKPAKSQESALMSLHLWKRLRICSFFSVFREIGPFSAEIPADSQALL